MLSYKGVFWGGFRPFYRIKGCQEHRKLVVSGGVFSLSLVPHSIKIPRRGGGPRIQQNPQGVRLKVYVRGAK